MCDADILVSSISNYLSVEASYAMYIIFGEEFYLQHIFLQRLCISA